MAPMRAVVAAAFFCLFVTSAFCATRPWVRSDHFNYQHYLVEQGTELQVHKAKQDAAQCSEPLRNATHFWMSPRHVIERGLAYGVR